MWSHQQGNVWKYHKNAGHGPNILQDLKTQQDFQQPGHLRHWSNHICGNVWKHRKIAGHGEKFEFLKPPKYHQICGDVWKYHKIAGHGPNILHDLKTQQDFPQPGDLSHWSHQICGNAWKYHKVAGHGENFKLLKPPNISKYVAMIAGHGGKFDLLKPPSMWQRGNAWKYRTSAVQKIVSNEGALNLLKAPNIWQCLKIPTKNVSHGSHPIFCKFWKYHKIASNGGARKLLKPPKCGNVWRYHRIAGHGGKFKLLKPPNITKYVAMFVNTTRLQATREHLSYWSTPNIWPYLRIHQVYHQRWNI